MTDRCAPPPNTTPGTVCVLSCDGDTSADRDRIQFEARWGDDGMWE